MERKLSRISMKRRGALLVRGLERRGYDPTNARDRYLFDALPDLVAALGEVGITNGRPDQALAIARSCRSIAGLPEYTDRTLKTERP